jgi:hypothetical protein
MLARIDVQAVGANANYVGTTMLGLPFSFLLVETKQGSSGFYSPVIFYVSLVTSLYPLPFFLLFSSSFLLLFLLYWALFLTISLFTKLGRSANLYYVYSLFSSCSFSKLQR